MATLTKKLGPAEHGQTISYEDFLAADYQSGYEYEIIEGKLYVVPKPNVPQAVLERWIYRKLDRYSDARPDIINYVYTARVFVSLDRPTTAPEPDIAAFHDFPLALPLADLRWEDLWPILVVEVVSPNDPKKDFVRNVKLYLRVSSIKEYWILDNREDPERPTLHVYRRHGKRWRVFKYDYGEIYTTKLLPDFELLIDPRQ